MPDPTPEPVLKDAAATALALMLLTNIAGFTAYKGWWAPSVEDIAQYAGLFGTLVGVVLVVKAWFVHNRTTPTANVALTVDDVKLLEAATDPQTPIGMGRLRDAAQIARDRIPPTKGTS